MNSRTLSGENAPLVADGRADSDPPSTDAAPRLDAGFRPAHLGRRRERRGTSLTDKQFLSIMGLFRNDPEVKNADLDCSPQNDYASEEAVAKIDGLLEPDEKVHFLAREAGGGVDLEGSSAGASLFGDDKVRLLGTMGDVRTAATDRRLLVKIPRALGSDDRSVPYHEIREVDLDLEGLYKRLSVRTSDRAYHVDVGGLSAEECREMARFVEERSPEAGEGEPLEDPDPDADVEPDPDADPDADVDPETGPDMVEG